MDLEISLAALTQSVAQVTLRLANASLVLTPVYQPCPSSTTSAMGSLCTLVCPVSSSYVNANGTCTPCTVTQCRINQGYVACSGNQDQTCVPCPAIPTGAYTRIYNTPGSCSILDTSYVAPCPPNTYLSATVIQGLRVCVACPAYSLTAADGAVSR